MPPAQERREQEGKTHVIRIVHGEHPTPAPLDDLVALPAAAHDQRRVHVRVMAGQVQADQQLEDQAPPGEGTREEDEQAGGGAAVGDHVEDGAEAGGLVEAAGGDAVEGVEQAGDAVEDGAGAGVEGHVVEGGDGEDDAGVAFRGG